MQSSINFSTKKALIPFPQLSLTNYEKMRLKRYKRKKASSFLEALASSGEQDRTADLRVMNPAL